MRSATDLRWPHLGRAPQIVAFILVIGLVGAMAIEPTRQLLDQRERISAMASELREIQEGNIQIASQIDRLNNDDYIEQRAREQIGLVRPGETTYVVMPPSAPDRGADKRKQRNEAAVEPPAPPSFLEAAVHFILGF